MKSALVLTVVAALMGAQAQANDGLQIVSNDVANVVHANLSGDNNALWIQQTHDQLGGANSLSLQIAGDLNGGPLGTAFDSAPALTGLVPGRIIQTGHDNTMSIGVTGLQNLFAMSQIGSGNTLTATITGNYNQAAVSQMGSGNSLSFVQNGYGNMLSVVQRSW